MQQDNPTMVNPFRFSVSASFVNDPDDFVEFCRKAEGHGYSAVSYADHLEDMLAPLIALSAAASATETLRLVTMVLANDYRHPVFLAKEITSLDRFSGGRVEFGIGAGWMRADYDQAGLPYDRPGVRIARLAESVAILTAALAGEQVDFEGEYYSVTGFVNSPAPVQQPRPPLLLAGGAQKMLSLAAAQADIVGLVASMSAGVYDENMGRTLTAAATDKKLEWVRAAAGNRFTDIELQSRVNKSYIGDGARDVAESFAATVGLKAEQLTDSPHALICADAQEAIDTLHRWRDRWGISYIGFSAHEIDMMAPVVAALAGT